MRQDKYFLVLPVPGSYHLLLFTAQGPLIVTIRGDIVQYVEFASFLMVSDVL